MRSSAQIIRWSFYSIANMSSNSNVFRITALVNSDTLYQMSRFEKGSCDWIEDDVVQFQ